MDEYMEIAIANDNADLLRELLTEKPQRLEQRNKHGETPLIHAVYTPRRSLAVIKTLVEAGAEVNARNRGGFMALHVVIWDEYFQPESAKSEDIINLLLDAGAELEDDQNDWACTPLMCAVIQNICSDARLLLSRGANPNQVLSERTILTSSAGLTLLSFAWREPAMMQILIEAGADVNLRDAFGQTTLEWIEGWDAGEYEAQKQQSLALLRQANSTRD